MGLLTLVHKTKKKVGIADPVGRAGAFEHGKKRRFYTNRNGHTPNPERLRARGEGCLQPIWHGFGAELESPKTILTEIRLGKLVPVVLNSRLCCINRQQNNAT
jgi:hypothetical protein